MEAAARPFPNEDTTPPVTKMYLADISATSLNGLEVCAWCARLSMAGFEVGSNGRLLASYVLCIERECSSHAGVSYGFCLKMK